MSDAEELQALRRLAELEAKASPQPQPTAFQSAQASIPGRILQGARDSIDAGAQLLPRGLEQLTSGFGMMPNRVSDFFGSEAHRVDAINAGNEREYQAARSATGSEGSDVARLVGNVFSPTNAALALKMPAAAMTTIPRMMATGAAGGAVGGLLTPVNDPRQQNNFGENKLAETGIGAVTGAALTPLVGKALAAAAPYVSRAADRVFGDPQVAGVRALLETDNVIAAALRDIGQTVDDVPKAQIGALRAQVLSALKDGKKLDAAALLRKGDFDAMGLPYTQGQITREATQFAKEKNLRGVPGVGEPLQQRFDVQNQGLQQLYGGFAKGASEHQTAGDMLIAALRSRDAEMKGPIDAAYSAARDSAGRSAQMDTETFSRNANNALDEGMLGHYLPAEVRSILNDVSTGKIPFNVNTSVQIDQVLSSAQRSAGQGSPQALAIGKVRDAMNSAPIENALGQDTKQAFNSARDMAAKRFAAHRELPAMADAVDGSASADRFVQKYIVSADTKKVKALAAALDPDALQQARAQIGATIQRAAFGNNQAGDKLIAPERLAEALRNIGTGKLSAFFSPQEVEQMYRAARVGAYINSTPTSAAVNTSNTAGAAAALNLAAQVPGIPAKVSLLRAPIQSVINQRTVSKAVNPEIPQSSTGASAKAMRTAQLAAALSGLIGGGAVAHR